MSVAPSFLGRPTGSRIALSPWSAAAMDPDTLATLEARCLAMDVFVSTIKRRRGEWMVRVGRDQRVVSLVGKGTVAVVIAAALDDFEEAVTA